jgi:uncharacterized membrane protein YeaQ/YmgE (transglycosylase-associated protein family)
MTPIIHKKINTLASGLVIISVFTFGTPIFVNAQTAVKAGTSEFGAPVNSTYTLLEPLPCIASAGSNCTSSSPPTTTINIQTYIVYIFKLMIALAVFAAVVMCIIGGFEYMLTDSVSKKLDAKGTIKNAVLGLAGALCSWLILYTINPNLVNVSLVTVPKLNVSTTTIDLTPTNINSSTDTKVAAMAAAGVAQDNALQAQVDTDQKNENNLFDQYNACTPPGSSACQDLYDQYVAAQDKTNADMIKNATTYETNNINVQIANTAKYTTPAQFAQGITNVENETQSAISQLPNNALTAKQTLINQENVATTTMQNQSVVTSYETQMYGSQSSAKTTEDADINTITANANAARAATTDPATLQQITANELSQQNAIRAAKPNAPSAPRSSLTGTSL